MSVDREFESVLEAWAEGGEEQARHERATDLAAAAEQAYRRAYRWARLTTFVPFSSMPPEEGDADAQLNAQRSA